MVIDCLIWLQTLTEWSQFMALNWLLAGLILVGGGMVQNYSFVCCGPMWPATSNAKASPTVFFAAFVRW